MVRRAALAFLLADILILGAGMACAQSAYIKMATARETWEASTRATGAAIEYGPWYYIGPFDSTGGAGFDAQYPPEKQVDLAASYQGKAGRTIRWQRGDRFSDGVANSLTIFDDNDWIAVYMYRTIIAPSARELPVLMGSDDTLTVWLNGEKLLAHNVSRACTVGDERLTLKLRAGKNDLLLKVCQGGGPSGFGFAVDTGSNTLLQRIAADFPDQINDLLIELDWLRQAKIRKLPPGVSVSPEDDAPGGCDGIKDGGTGFHTQLEDKPWWQVDLGKTYRLSHALLYNRESCAERNNYLIMLLSDDGNQWRQVWQNNGTLFYGAKDGKPMRVPLAGQSARFVRLQLPGRNYLHLDEIEVYGADKPDLNLALNQPAMESSSSPWSTYTPLKNPAAPDEAADRRMYRQATLDALDLARRTLDFVGAQRPLPDQKTRLDGLAQKIAAAANDADWKALYLQTRHLRRDIILSHPLLAFDQLLISKRPPPLYSHMVDQYEGRHSQSGDGLVLLKSWRSVPQAVALLQGKLPLGTVAHPDLSYDGKRVVFSYCDHTPPTAEARRFFLYEMNLETGAVKQLTGVPGVDPLQGWAGRNTVLIEDFDPCYLPDGGIMFISTRNQGFGRCHDGRYTPSYVLYRCDGDGKHIRRLSYGEANEWNPSVMPNGEIIYTRWDYINRHDTLFQSLWTTRPDGSAVAHYYANSTRNPCMVAQAKAIPGADLVAALATAHHSYSAGSIIAIDRRKGEEGLDPVTRITPEVPFPETEGWPVGAYADPYPLSSDLYLAAYMPDPLITQGNVTRPEAYGIYLVDTLGGRELIYRDPKVSCFAPTPVQPRPEPPALQSSLVAGRTDGTFFIQDVYHSAESLPAGSVKSVRIVEMHEQPEAAAADRSVISQEVVKSVVGTVPVNADGSVLFNAPAQVPLLFQLLDEHNTAIFSMRSQVYLQPGETMSCAGCHEPRASTPPVSRRAALRLQSIAPPPGPAYAGGFSFPRTVQPVLDRYCISCHGLERKSGGLSLLGTTSARFTEAYDALVSRPGLVSLAQRNEQSDVSKRGDYGARAGRLASFLLSDHSEKVHLDPDSYTRIVEWLDLNCQCYGDYNFNRKERRQPSAEGVQALRTHLAASCGACHKTMAQQPLAALVNIAQPDESRVLKAPLATAAGGWGQCKQTWGDTASTDYTAMLERVLAATGEP
jgi:hypothetical protein